MKKSIIFVLSVAWLLPLWGHFYAMHSWHNAEVIPKLDGEVVMNSFPQYEFAQQLLFVAGAWFSMVVVFWFGCLVFKGSFRGNL